MSAVSARQALASAAELRRQVAERLEAAGVASPAADARWLIAHATGIDPHVRPRAELDDPGEALWSAVARREAREPLQLIVGTTAFRALELRCAPGVFVPRPETELVAGEAIARARERVRPVVVEPGTGTGAIACSVAVEVTGARVCAGDLDARAVALARENAGRAARGRAGPAGLAPGATVEVRQGGLLDAVPDGLRGRVDVLVCNPPYLPAGDLPSLAPEVAAHDPAAALFGGGDGHELVDALLDAAADWLRPGGSVVLEIDARRAAEAAARTEAAGLVDVAVLDDLTGAPRILTARRQGPR